MLRGAFCSAGLVGVVLVLDGGVELVVVPLGVQVLETELALGGRGGSGVVDVELLGDVLVLGGGATLSDGRSSFWPSAMKASSLSLFSLRTSSIHWRSCVSGTFCAMPMPSSESPDLTTSLVVACVLGRASET